VGRSRVVFNRLPAVAQTFVEATAEATPEAADEMLDAIQAALDAGEDGISSDTTALAKSLYVKATGRDDYEKALAAARAAFKENPSRWRTGLPDEKAVAHFNAIVAPRDELKDVPEHVFIAAVTTALSYGNVWEFEREWMLPAAMKWATARVGEFYAGRLAAALK
jgi:hypothetical protein